VKVKAYGHANLEHEVLAHPDTVYQLASLTKPLVATAVMRLVEEGSLKLDDRIRAHFEKLPDTWKEITVAQLLSHTSGLRDYLNPRLLDGNRVYTPREIIDQVILQPLKFVPGQRWEYSNTNYLLLGMLIEKKSGKRFDHYLADQVFRPLGMAATGRRDLEQLCPHRAAAYDWRGDRFTNSRYLEPSAWDNADGGLVSSVADLVRFDAALSAGKVLPSAVLERMWQHTRLPNGKLAPYGLGWESGDVRGHRRVGHGGGRAGASTCYARYPDDEISVVALANCSGVDLRREVVEAVAGMYRAVLLPPHLRKEVSDDQPAAARLVRRLLDDIAAGKRDSTLVAEGNRDIVSEPQRRLTKMLAESKGLVYLGSENTAQRDLHGNGARVAQVRHYKLVTDEVVEYLTVYLTADGLVADQDVYERPGARTTEPPKSVDDIVLAEMKAQNIPGCSVAVLHDGRAVFAKGFGKANLELDVAATEQTVYEIASLTKPFTAAAVLTLVNDGKLSLQDKLIDLVDACPAAWGAITVGQLLNHTSGIKDYTSVPGFVRRDAWHARSPAELVGLVRAMPLNFEPGKGWDYTNTGYVLLGMIVERKSGTSYGRFLQDRLFGPLNMHATRVDDLGTVVKGRAAGYTLREGKLVNRPHVDPSNLFAAGGLLSTVTDLAKWDAALYTDSPLSQKQREAMWGNPVHRPQMDNGYGYGWYVNPKSKGGPLVFHGGGTPGFGSRMSRYLTARITVIVLANASHADVDKIADRIAKLWIST
jgi:CubicO group peptidase (beta-lactamase class C family)